ncbi:MAG: hypothetical protein RR614_08535, partial [Eubacterium sp.]
MEKTDMVASVVFLVTMFLVYNYLVFELVDSFLIKPKLKKVFRIPVGILNTLVVVVLALLIENNTFGLYIAMGIILFIEFQFFYKDEYTSSLFCMLACITHI